MIGPTVASTSPSPDPTRARIPRQVVRGPGLLRLVAVAAFSEGDRAFGLRQILVNKRERCVDDFLPYPGIVRNTCENQSELWLGGHQVLRGGGWAREVACLAAPSTTSIRSLYARPARCVRRVQGMCYLASTQLVAACPFVGGTTRLHGGFFAPRGSCRARRREGRSRRGGPPLRLSRRSSCSESCRGWNHRRGRRPVPRPAIRSVARPAALEPAACDLPHP